jgi:hypothetical protein
MLIKEHVFDSTEQLRSLLHFFNYRYVERTSFLTAMATYAVRSISLQRLIVRTHRLRNSFLHGCQVIELVDHCNVNSLRAWSTMATVRALPIPI